MFDEMINFFLVSSIIYENAIYCDYLSWIKDGVLKIHYILWGYKYMNINLATPVIKDDTVTKYQIWYLPIEL